MKYPLPIEVVKSRFPILTQEYGNTSNNAWYKKNGIDIEAHNGADFVISGGAVATYGTRLVCPVPNARATRLWWESPMSTKGNGIQIQWSDENGFCQAILWHASEVNFLEEYKEGDTLGYMGNSGLCKPPHTVWNVHAGSHLHLGTWINGSMVDPREIFDFAKWFTSEKDTGVEKDLSPFPYYLSKIFDIMRELFLKEK